MEAFLIVDVRPSSTAADRLFDLRRVVPRINRLASRVRRRGGAVIFVRPGTAPELPVAPRSSGRENEVSLVRDPGDWIVRKTLNDPFLGTFLDDLLSELDALRVIIAGWPTDLCVDATVRSAVSRCYHVVVAADCHTLDDRPHLTAMALIEYHNWLWTQLIAPGSIRVVPERDIHPLGSSECDTPSQPNDPLDWRD